MKVNPFRHVGMNPYNQQVNKKDQTAANGKTDKVEISSEAKELQQTPSIVKERELKIAELKKQIQNGTYQVDHEAVAKKMADFYRVK